jgi:ABC-type multidrug transport system fused ATPase/permease subunit
MRCARISYRQLAGHTKLKMIKSKWRQTKLLMHIARRYVNRKIFSGTARLWNHLSRKRKIQLTGLMILMIASAISELISLGAIIPFLTSLTSPETVRSAVDGNDIWPVSELAYFSDAELIAGVTIIFVGITIVASLIRLLSLYISGIFAALVGSDIGKDVYSRILYQPYKYHIETHTSNTISAITVQVNLTVVGLNGFLSLCSSSIIGLALIGGIIVINWQIAAIISLLYCSVYLIIARKSQVLLTKNSAKYTYLTEALIKSVQEGLGAIRNVIIDNSQDFYISIYEDLDKPQRLIVAQNNFLSAYPRLILETIGIISLSLMGLFMVSVLGYDYKSIVPVLGAFALGAQRLLPALQQIYSGWSQLKSNKSSISKVLEILNLSCQGKHIQSNKYIRFHELILENLSFSHCSQSEKFDIIKNLSLRIRAGDKVGVIGETGCGKSTIIDIIMTLLEPTEGTYKINNIDINSDGNQALKQYWRTQISHVPQNIYLFDASFASNIAVGVPEEKIDYERIRLSASSARIYDYIVTQQNGLKSNVGEKGVKLSGGQRQRIGIARALYKQAQILILDEATSALDDNTEQLVMDSIYSLAKDQTVIIIAHRKSTLERCDYILKIKEGRLTEVGPPSIILKQA